MKLIDQSRKYDPSFCFKICKWNHQIESHFFLNKWNVVLKLLLSYLAALGLSCVTWDLPCSMPGLPCGLPSLVVALMLSSCCAWVQYLLCVGSVVAVRGFSSCCAWVQ